jgi:hypothetical protein
LHVDFEVADIDVCDLYSLSREFGTLPFKAVALSGERRENRGHIVKIMIAVPPPSHALIIELKHFRRQSFLVNDRHGVFPFLLGIVHTMP